MAFLSILTGEESSEPTPPFTAPFEAPASAFWMNARLGTHIGGVSSSQLAPCPKAPHVPFPPTVRVWNLKSSSSMTALLFRALHCWASIMTITTVAQDGRATKQWVFTGRVKDCKPSSAMSESELTKELGVLGVLGVMGALYCEAWVKSSGFLWPRFSLPVMTVCLFH